MKNKRMIIAVISIILLAIAFFLGVILLFLFLDKKEAINTKEELIKCFNENYELFEEAKNEVEQNDFPTEITINKQNKGYPTEFIIYYEDTQNMAIINLFTQLDWRVNTINKRIEDLTTDEGIIFTKFGGKAMSNYWGVYYVESDSLIGWDGQKRFKPTEKQGEGYFIEAYGCRYYTEKICENWWYFEALYD